MSLSTLCFHRASGLGLTKRFVQGMPSLGDNASAVWQKDAPVQRITFSNGTNLECEAAVRAFVPDADDVTGRFFTSADDRHVWVDLPAYAIVKPEAYLAFLRETIPTLVSSLSSPAQKEALRLSGRAPELTTLLLYDVARSLKIYSSFLTGPATLGIAPLPADAHTMPGKPPLPRMITAQCDAITNLLLDELLAALFGDNGNDGVLVQRLLSTDPEDAHIGFVALAVLAGGTLVVIADKKRRNLQTGQTDDDSLQVQLEANMKRLLDLFFGAGKSLRALRTGLSPDAVAFYEHPNADWLASFAPEYVDRI